MNETWHLAGLLALSAVALATADPAGQVQQPSRPTFRTDVEAVVLDVSVLDEHRRPVRGLTAEDFVVLEDGQPQAITTFSAVDLPEPDAPQSGSWLTTVPADVVTNAVPADGRVVVLVLDDLTPMAPGDAPRAIDLANMAVDGLGPSDIAAVVFTAGRAAGCGFTSEHARLEAAVARFSPRMSRDFEQFDDSSGPAYIEATATIRKLVDLMADLGQRRKALLWVSAGMPLSVERPRLISPDSFVEQLRSDEDRVRDGWVELFAAAGRANVNLYGLDPGGLRGEAIDLQEGPTTRAIYQSDPAAADPTAPVSATREAGKVNRRFLEDVSANTGGFVVTGSNDPGPGLKRVFADTGTYYLLGYQSSNLPSKEKLRTLQVRVNQPGVTVRCRTGYAAEPSVGQQPSVTAPSLLTDSLHAVLPARGVGLRSAAAAFQATGRDTPTVAVVLGVDQATPARPAVTIDDVAVVVSAYDAQGKAAGSVTSHAKVGLPAGSANVQYEVLMPIDVKPGHYDLRIAAATTFAPRAGSVTCDVDVPDFAKAPLSLSGLVLSVGPDRGAARRDALRSWLAVVPTSRRDFAPDEKVTALVRAYQGGKGAVSPVALAVTIIDSQGGTVHQAAETLGPERFAVDRGVDYRLDLPLDRLVAGPHLLTITATAGKAAALRVVRFEVH
jgi:VWFA-related protein